MTVEVQTPLETEVYSSRLKWWIKRLNDSIPVSLAFVKDALELFRNFVFGIGLVAAGEALVAEKFSTGHPALSLIAFVVMQISGLFLVVAILYFVFSHQPKTRLRRNLWVYGGSIFLMIIVGLTLYIVTTHVIWIMQEQATKDQRNIHDVYDDKNWRKHVDDSLISIQKRQVTFHAEGLAACSSAVSESTHQVFLEHQYHRQGKVGTQRHARHLPICRQP